MYQITKTVELLSNSVDFDNLIPNKIKCLRNDLCLSREKCLRSVKTKVCLRMIEETNNLFFKGTLLKFFENPLFPLLCFSWNEQTTNEACTNSSTIYDEVKRYETLDPAPHPERTFDLAQKTKRKIGKNVQTIE
jgi:hypothetical protein